MADVTVGTFVSTEEVARGRARHGHGLQDAEARPRHDAVHDHDHRDPLARRHAREGQLAGGDSTSTTSSPSTRPTRRVRRTDLGRHRRVRRDQGQRHPPQHDDRARRSSSRPSGPTATYRRPLGRRPSAARQRARRRQAALHRLGVPAGCVAAGHEVRQRVARLQLHPDFPHVLDLLADDDRRSSCTAGASLRRRRRARRWSTSASWSTTASSARGTCYTTGTGPQGASGGLIEFIVSNKQRRERRADLGLPRPVPHHRAREGVVGQGDLHRHRRCVLPLPLQPLGPGRVLEADDARTSTASRWTASSPGSSATRSRWS